MLHRLNFSDDERDCIMAKMQYSFKRPGFLEVNKGDVILAQTGFLKKAFARLTVKQATVQWAGDNPYTTVIFTAEEIK